MRTGRASAKHFLSEILSERRGRRRGRRPVANSRRAYETIPRCTHETILL